MPDTKTTTVISKTAACTCGPGQQCDPLRPGCWGYQPKAHALEGTAEARSDPAAVEAILRKLGYVK